MTAVAASPSPHWQRGSLLVVGVSHHATPVEVRERLVFDVNRWAQRTRGQFASVLLATCNRVEVYAWTSTNGRGARLAGRIKRALAESSGLPPDALAPYTFSRVGSDAVRHLLRVTSGLDSVVVGEEQIRGQVREAHRLARAAGPLPGPLDAIFHRAFEAARRVRGGTRLGHHPSIASAAVEIAHRSPELAPTGVQGQIALVLGAGVMAKAAANALQAHGAHIVLLNRTPAHALRIAAQLAGTVEVDHLDHLDRWLSRAAVVVGATAARLPVLQSAQVARATLERGGRPLMILDIAVPRDVEPAVRDLPGVRLVDMDDLEALCPVDVTTRHSEVRRAETLAVEEAQAIEQWLRVRAVAPRIVALRQFAEGVRAAELRRSAARLRGLTAEQQAAVDALTASIVNKLLHEPTVALREAAARPRSRTIVRSRAHRAPLDSARS